MTVATTAGDVDWNLVPNDARDVLLGTITDAARREAMLLAAARKFDPDRLRSLGMAGEAAVVAACRTRWLSLGQRELASRVQQVSLVSDQLGYDVICPRSPDHMWRMEVKTWSGSRRPRFFLSSNEARVAQQIDDWVLVGCRQLGDEIDVIGWADSAILDESLPLDRRIDWQWNSVEVVLDPSELEPGLPPLQTTGRVTV